MKKLSMNYPRYPFLSIALLLCSLYSCSKEFTNLMHDKDTGATLVGSFTVEIGDQDEAGMSGDNGTLNKRAEGIIFVNPVALRMAKTLWSLDCSECSRVKSEKKNML